MSRIHIRAACPADFDAWLLLWRGYQAFYKVDIADDVTRSTWQRFHDDAEPMHCDLAEVDGVVRGLVHSIDHRSCWMKEPSCYLQDLFVAPECRGQGLGRRLIEHVCAGQGTRLRARALADARDQYRRDEALRPHCRQARLRAVPQGGVAPCGNG
jgi:ribosomal protein S18 acetylase RimI-like enzyme